MRPGELVRLRDRGSEGHVCWATACCEVYEPTYKALNIIDAGLRSYEWFRDEGDKAARKATRLVAVALIGSYFAVLIAWVVFKLLGAA